MSTAVVYRSEPGLEPYSLSDAAKRRYRKQLAYEGQFEKGDMRFSLGPAMFKHWVEIFKKFREKGIKLPLYIEHPKNQADGVEKNRGEVVELECGVDEKGRQSLYGLCEFRDEEAEKLTKTADVSVFASETFKDGTGEEYVWPLQHIALTDRPVLPGLAGFQVLAASLITHKEIKMSLASLAEKVGIPVADKDEAEIEAAVVMLFTEMKKKLDDAEAVADDGEGDGTPPPEQVSASLLGVYRENRTNKIDRLVEQGKITPAVAAELKKTWVADKALSLAHTDETAMRSFDSIIASLNLNEPVLSFQEKTRGQASSLQNTKVDAANNPLVANAERRAAAHK